MHSYLFITVIAIAQIVSTSAFGSNQAQEILSYYPYIQEINNGPVIWNEDTSNPYNLGRRYRAVIYRQEIYYGLIVETYRAVDEGGFEFINHENVRFDMNTKNIVFISWISSNSFQIEIGKDTYKIVITETGINKKKVIN